MREKKKKRTFPPIIYDEGVSTGGAEVRFPNEKSQNGATSCRVQTRKGEEKRTENRHNKGQRRYCAIFLGPCSALFCTLKKYFCNSFGRDGRKFLFYFYFAHLLRLGEVNKSNTPSSERRRISEGSLKQGL